jgi:transposase
MAADLALAADPDMIERSADPAGFVVQACQRAKAWLQEALEHGEIGQVAEIKSQAEAVRVYTTQKQLGKDAQLAAAEIVRRAERGIGVAIRRGQHNGEIARRGDRGGCGAPGVYGGNPGARRGDHLGSPGSFFRHGDERADAYAMTDGVSDTDFDDALRQAKAEGNLSRANVVRKIRQRRHNPPAPGGHVPDSADRSPEAVARRQELIEEFAASGMSSRQIAQRLGIGDDTVRQVARERGIDIPADTVLGRTRRPDSNRIVRETVHALEGLAMGVELADPAGLDSAEAAEWAVSMTRSIRLLTRFVRQMKETIR